jgi:hypothetical protein
VLTGQCTSGGARWREVAVGTDADRSTMAGAGAGHSEEAGPGGGIEARGGQGWEWGGGGAWRRPGLGLGAGGCVRVGHG